jgi:quinol monooxygenase YgiN
VYILCGALTADPFLSLSLPLLCPAWQYRVSRSADDKKTILIVEEYEDAEALTGTHAAGEAYKELIGKFGALIETMNARFYQD